MSDEAGEFILGDIGGTHARFAVSAGGAPGPIEDMPVASYPRIVDALTEFLRRRPDAKPKGAVLAGAGPVFDNRIKMTNSPWVIDGAELGKAFSLPWVQVINDFEAQAWALPALSPKDLFRVGGGAAVTGAPRVVLGPGTGLGVACLVDGAQGSQVIVSEGGHATLPVGSAREDGVIEQLRSRFGHVSAERALSGGGLVNLYRAVATLDGEAVPEREAAEISKEALGGASPASRQALDLFCAFLGTFAGDAALMFGARGGVFIAGGIVPRFLDFLTRSEFRARFEAKGRLSSYVQGVPTAVVTHKEPAFVGLAYLATELSRRSGR